MLLAWLKNYLLQHFLMVFFPSMMICDCEDLIYCGPYFIVLQYLHMSMSVCAIYTILTCQLIVISFSKKWISVNMRCAFLKTLRSEVANSK